MLQLAIDTSSGFIQIALKDQHKIYIKKSNKQQHQAEDVALILNNLLAEHNYNFSQISKIFCVVGPASFTGIRISLAFVKGLILGQDIEVVPISNFHFFISNFLDKIIHYQNSHIFLDCGKNKQECYYLIIQNQFAIEKQSDDLTMQNQVEQLSKVITYQKAQEILCAGKDKLSNDFFLGNFTNLTDIIDQQNIMANLFTVQYADLDLTKLFALPSYYYQKKLAPISLRKAVY